MKVRVGVDVGGTFTGIIYFDETLFQFTLLKVPSTPKDPELAVYSRVKRILMSNELDP